MRFIKTIGILLLFALLAQSAAATTENKEMPTEKEVTAFIDGLKATDVNSIYNDFTEQYPAAHCDIWNENLISLYFYDPDSPREYGSIYLDSNGEKAKPGCGVNADPIKSYKGENVKEEVKEDDKKVSEDKEDVKEEAVTDEDKAAVTEVVKEEAPEEVPEMTEEQKVTEEKEVTEDQKAPEEVKEEVENTTVPEVKEDTPAVKETSDDKIQSIMKFFNTGDMNATSLEKCLYHYFGDD